MQHQDINSRIDNIYGLAMPESFFAFWDFANRVTFPALRDALDIIGLLGPFDLLQNDLVRDHDPIWHARYYNDPPEFLTLMAGLTDGYHWGYYIDDPAQPQFTVASYYSNDAFEIHVAGADLFEATRRELELHYRDCLDYLTSDPKYASEYEARLKQFDGIRTLLQQYGTADRQERGWEYYEKYHVWGTSQRKTVAATRDAMGIVVPQNAYRPLDRDDPFQIWNYHPSADEAQQMTDSALESLRAGFPGTALKLGKDLWIYSEHQSLSYRLLDDAYDALHRPLLRRYLDIARRYREWCDAKH
jgi:hypothetical protein